MGWYLFPVVTGAVLAHGGLFCFGPHPSWEAWVVIAIVGVLVGWIKANVK